LDSWQSCYRCFVVFSQVKMFFGSWEMYGHVF
jgi:hypothetical protein